MNVLVFSTTYVKKNLHLVKSSIFCVLLNLRIIWPSTEQFGIWDERQGVTCYDVDSATEIPANKAPPSNFSYIISPFLHDFCTTTAQYLHSIRAKMEEMGSQKYVTLRHATWLDPCLVELGSEPNTVSSVLARFLKFQQGTEKRIFNQINFFFAEQLS